jgi:hypothetical protein
MAYDSVAPLVGAALGAMRESSSLIRLARGKEDKTAATKRRRGQWAAAIGWLIAGVAGLYALDCFEASRAERMVDTVYRETFHLGGLKRQSAVGNYLETGAPVPLEVLERITRAAPESMVLTSLNYARAGETTLQGTLANEKECQQFLKNLGELGHVELRRARPDQDRFRFEINLSFTRSSGASSQPATAPATTSASAPATQPTTTAPAAPATSPASRPATQSAGEAK